jgi:hypothetical protein
LGAASFLRLSCKALRGALGGGVNLEFAPSFLGERELLKRKMVMINTVAVCIAVSVVAICITIVTFLLSRERKQRAQYVSYGTIEKIKELGDLVALSVHAKEIVTVEMPNSWYGRGEKMAMICGFDIEYRFNLKQCDFTRNDMETRISLPPQHIKISTQNIHIYDEQKGVVLWAIPKEVPTATRNELIVKAREEAAKRAHSLNQDWLEKAQESAKETIAIIARGMNVQNLVVEFKSSLNTGSQLVDAIKKMAA